MYKKKKKASFNAKNTGMLSALPGLVPKSLAKPNTAIYFSVNIEISLLAMSYAIIVNGAEVELHCIIIRWLR